MPPWSTTAPTRWTSFTPWSPSWPVWSRPPPHPSSRFVNFTILYFACTVYGGELIFHFCKITFRYRLDLQQFEFQFHIVHNLKTLPQSQNVIAVNQIFAQLVAIVCAGLVSFINDSNCWLIFRAEITQGRQIELSVFSYNISSAFSS